MALPILDDFFRGLSFAPDGHALENRLAERLETLNMIEGSCLTFDLIWEGLPA